jgi:Arc/MetJ-type ribon-helix-helix transcriptional regulator
MMRVHIDSKTQERIQDLLAAGRYKTRDEILKDAVRLVNLREAELQLMAAGLRYVSAADEAGVGASGDTVAQAVVASFKD